MKLVLAIILLILLIIIGKFSLLTVSFEPKDIGLSEIVYDVISVVVHLILFFCAGLLLSVVIPHIFSNHLTQFYLTLIIFVFGIILAGCSEYLQIATSRDASFVDFCFDLIGFYIGALLFRRLSQPSLSKYFKA